MAFGLIGPPPAWPSLAPSRPNLTGQMLRERRAEHRSDRGDVSGREEGRVASPHGIGRTGGVRSGLLARALAHEVQVKALGGGLTKAELSGSHSSTGRTRACGTVLLLVR